MKTNKPVIVLVLFIWFVISFVTNILGPILPLMREAGGEKNYAFYAVLAQVVFGAASFISPFALTALMRRLAAPSSADNLFLRLLRDCIPAELSWSSFYLIFTGVFVLTLILIAYIKFPKITLREEEKAGTRQHYMELLRNKHVILFSLALNSVEKHHGAFSGILCTGIFGGALVPFLIGGIGDLIGLRGSMLILLVTLSYILSISFWAKPLVKNQTIWKEVDPVP